MQKLTTKFTDIMGSLEHIREDQHGMLVGGFTTVKIGDPVDNIIETNVTCPPSNGNCVGCDGGIPR